MLSWIVPGHLVASPIRLCQDEIEETPWRTASNDGLNNVMLRMVESRLKLEIQIEKQPWRRCLSMVQQGEFDGAIAASFRPERQEIGAYPASASGQMPDRHRRMSGEVYYFYKHKDSPFDWDGSAFSGTQLPVAAPMGYSAVERLQEKGLRVDDRERHPEHLLRKVLAGTNAAAVLAQGEGDRLLANPRYADKLVRLTVPFYQTDGYLLLSHALVRRDPQLAERIWNGIAEVRASAAYRKELSRRGVPHQD